MKKIFGLIIFFVIGCGKDDPKIPDPAVLIFPAQNSECTTGVEISPTSSRVDFRWNASKNTDTYQIEVKNLISNSTQTASTSSTTLGVVITKGTPFSWKIISKNNESQEETSSQTWLFYNAGTETSYAPFPAQITSPSSGATASRDGNGEVLLSWIGADVDSDISGYEVFLDVADPPATSVGSLASGTTELNVAADAATVYFWRVITTDLEGNTSDSGIYSFRTQ
ncbi:MAG: hypothetical protein KJO04_07510 [Bacteroidia bacterium]|nr:hypothetical protein [Bacteroidia bacterium]